MKRKVVFFLFLGIALFLFGGCTTTGSIRLGYGFSLKITGPITPFDSGITPDEWQVLFLNYQRGRGTPPPAYAPFEVRKWGKVILTNEDFKCFSQYPYLETCIPEKVIREEHGEFEIWTTKGRQRYLLEKVRGGYRIKLLASSP